MRLEKLRIAIFFGGPSSERDISLDSARTFFDAVRFILRPQNIKIFFIDGDLQFTRVADQWMYANTIDDYILSRGGYGAAVGSRLDISKLTEELRDCDAVFSFVHGTYGEDGNFERDLREAGCELPLLGSSGAPLEVLYDKEQTLAALRRLGYSTADSYALNADDAEALKQAKAFASGRGRVVVKPTRGGSSDGVSVAAASTIEEAIHHAANYHPRVMVEEFIEGREFSIIIFEGIDGEVMPLLPTEIIVGGSGSSIYSRVKKYMPGSGATHINPARFGFATLTEIRTQAADLFNKLNLSDWARFDGFLKADGSVIWSDLNGVPGFGADSLLFQQSSLFRHDQTSISYYLLAKVMCKAGLSFTLPQSLSEGVRRIAVIGGGETSERQVSRMSWLNVIQKLSFTRRNVVRPIYLSKALRYWSVPTFATLQHTVEEIDDVIENTEIYNKSITWTEQLCGTFDPTFRSLMRPDSDLAVREMTLPEIAHECDFVFIALHGGIGEDGSIQRQLDALNCPYNGSAPEEAAIFMDKAETAAILAQKSVPGVRAPKNKVVVLEQLRRKHERTLSAFAQLVRHGSSYESMQAMIPLTDLTKEIEQFVAQWQSDLASAKGLVFKPVADGCSSGVFIWRNGDPGAVRYLACAMSGLADVSWAFLGPRFATVPPEVTLKLPFDSYARLLVEELHLSEPNDRVVELTAAVFGPKGRMVSMIPSQTLTEYDLLTLEEKFCKGVGVNITPPSDMSDEKITDLRGRIAVLANELGIRGYARVDLMYYVDRDELVLIEVNSLPGLSMATVTFTQALVTPEFRMPPSEFLEAVVEVGLNPVASTDRADGDYSSSNTSSSSSTFVTQ